MWPAWLEILAARPQLVVEHGQAYAQLLGEESAEALASWRRRFLLYLLMGLSLLLALVLAGVAGLIAAAVPVEGMPMPWLLVALPTVPLLVAVISWAVARKEQEKIFAGLQEQLRADAGLLQEMLGITPGAAP